MSNKGNIQEHCLERYKSLSAKNSPLNSVVFQICPEATGSLHEGATLLGSDPQVA